MADKRDPSVAIKREAHAVLVQVLGNNRKIDASLSNMIHWLARQDSDIRSIVLDGVTPEAEVLLLELLLARAKQRAKGPGSGRVVILDDEPIAAGGPSPKG